VPLAVLGANVTVFDVSEENKRYALELAECAGVSIKYEVGDFNNVDFERFGKSFDIAYLEGGIFHYFYDIDLFFHNLYCIIKPGGKLILSDFHPFRKIDATGYAGKFIQVIDGDYFDSRVFNGDVAYKSYFPQDEQQLFPDCSLRYYTLSEIINAAINTGFNIREFNEHPNWKNKKIPGEFTIIGLKWDYYRLKMGLSNGEINYYGIPINPLFLFAVYFLIVRYYLIGGVTMYEDVLNFFTK